MFTRLLVVSVFLTTLSSCGKTGNVVPPESPQNCSKKTLHRAYFGFNKPNGTVSDPEWQNFLASVVTPFFPKGLTVYEARGQWLGENSTIAKEPSRVVEVVSDGQTGTSEALKKIASDYKTRFQQEAVMVVRTSAEVCFE